jgi:glutaredoxin
VKLVLLGRPGCHLCDDARAVLQRLGRPFEEVDIELDEELHRRYLERIPVVMLDGQEVAELIVDEDDLRRRLGTPAPRGAGIPDALE